MLMGAAGPQMPRRHVSARGVFHARKTGMGYSSFVKATSTTPNQSRSIQKSPVWLFQLLVDGRQHGVKHSCARRIQDAQHEQHGKHAEKPSNT
jgi:hypothetical protein